MLDIGGSTGVVAAHFAREFGLRGTLIDPAPLEVDHARALGLETITGLVETHDFGASRYDVVLICQTIDHLLDVGGTLRRVRDLLTEGGFLFVDIVDFRAAYLRNGSVEDATKIDHPYYLTQDTMQAYLRRAGFAIVHADYAADHLHVSYLCRPAAPEPDALPDAGLGGRAASRSAPGAEHAASRLQAPGSRLMCRRRHRPGHRAGSRRVQGRAREEPAAAGGAAAD